MNTPQPSADAIRLAVLLSGHTNCQKAAEAACVNVQQRQCICDGCLGDAQTIDRELQLPQRNVALFKAQAVCDASDPLYDEDTVAELRAALKAL